MMFDKTAMEMIPISSLNALEYCPRSFYYQYVQGEMLVNEFVLEGQLTHQRVHQAGTRTTAEGEMETTRLYLYSEALHLTGFADVVEERAGVFLPVEYKHGSQGDWLNQHIQLCAQALCLEELLADHLSEAHSSLSDDAKRRSDSSVSEGLSRRRGSVVGGLNTKEQRQPGKPLIPHGYIYSLGSRRRVNVPFTPQLRATTKAAIVQAFKVAALHVPPPPLDGELAARCPNCSLFPLCLPEEVRQLQAKKKR